MEVKKEEKVVNEEVTLLDVNELLEVQGGIASDSGFCDNGIIQVNCSSGAVSV